MHVSITSCDTSGAAPEAGTMVGEEMDGWLRELEGYRGLVVVTRGDETLGIAFWESEETAARHAGLRAEFRERILTLAGAEIRGVDGYDVAYARVEL